MKLTHWDWRDTSLCAQKQMRVAIGLALAGAIFSVHAEFEQHAVHTHGSASLDLVVADEGVELVLVAPAESLLGFEHRPTTAAQRQRVDEVHQLLRRPLSLFDLGSKGACQQQAVKVTSPLFADASAPVSGKPSHDKHGHDKHGHDKHEHAAHDEPPEHEEASEHADIQVQWLFICAKGEAIGELEGRLWAHFPQLDRISVQWVTPDGQGAGHLTRQQPRLSFGH